MAHEEDLRRPGRRPEAGLAVLDLVLLVLLIAHGLGPYRVAGRSRFVTATGYRR